MRFRVGRAVRMVRRIQPSPRRMPRRQGPPRITPEIMVSGAITLAGAALLFAVTGMWQIGLAALVLVVAIAGRTMVWRSPEPTQPAAVRPASAPRPRATISTAVLDRHPVQVIVRTLLRMPPTEFKKRRLFEAYLDRRQPGWREDLQRDLDARRAEAARATAHAAAEQEAYEVLGLRAGASAEEIRAAHRALIRRAHPDAGGSAELAAKINEAKQRLLSGDRGG